MIIFSNENLINAKINIFIRKIKNIFLFILNDCLLRIILLIYQLIKNSFAFLYCHLYPKRNKIKKIAKTVIIIYSIFAIGYNIFLFFMDKELQLLFILFIPINILCYLAIKLLLYIYHIFIGNYQMLDEAMLYTEQYVKTKLPKLVKVYGPTGVGKDTLQAGWCSILSRHLHDKTVDDMSRIKNICYFIDFNLLDDDLLNNYNYFLTYSKTKIVERFIGTKDNPGLARIRKCYIKSDYKKMDNINDKYFLEDYYKFLEEPVKYESRFVIGNGVNRKHYMDLLLEYIEWFIHINIEKSFLITNQPFIENLDTGLMARIFTINSIRTKSETIKKRKNNKQETYEENIIFPWKNRLIVSETECGTWYLNVGEDIQKIMKSSGMRDFKAFQRHFMDDFYWFQVDQAPERVSKLFRELEHAYAGVISREFVEGGAKRNLILYIKLKILNYFIFKIEMKNDRLEMEKLKKGQKIEDIKRLYIASSNEKYKIKYNKIIKKLEPKAFPKRYYIYKRIVSDIEKQIEINKKDGFIIETVLISKSASSTMASMDNIVAIKDVLDSNFKYNTYCTQFIFKASDCERYDTRYMRNLAEERSYNTKVELMDLPFWPDNFKMTNKELEWMGYQAAKNMFGIKDEAYENIRFTNKYKEYLNNYK